MIWGRGFAQLSERTVGSLSVDKGLAFLVFDQSFVK